MFDLVDIRCNLLEYRLNDNSKWTLTEKASYEVDGSFIRNMVNSKVFFESNGGTMSIEMKSNKRFGVCISKIVSVSMCNEIKRIYSFNYSQAKAV